MKEALQKNKKAFISKEVIGWIIILAILALATFAIIAIIR